MRCLNSNIMLFSANRSDTGSYWNDKNVTWRVSDSDEYLPSAGFVGSLAAWNIYLFKNKMKKSFRDKEWEINPLTLEAGIPVLAAKKDDKISWEVKFDDVYCYNIAPSSGSPSHNKNEVDLYFSYVPFMNGVTTGSVDLDDKNLVKFKDGDVEYNYFTTTDRKGKVEFDMKEDSMIYVKAVPHWDSGHLTMVLMIGGICI